MLQEARDAAEKLGVLQAYRDTFDDDKFRITSVCLSTTGKLPAMHLEEAVLGQLSDRAGWVWSEREKGCGEYPYRASIAMFGVVFFAIFSRDDAIEYGCTLPL